MSGGAERRAALVLRWAGALGIAAIAVLRCVVAFAPKVVFDIDPAQGAGAFTGLGPAGSLVLDALLLAAAGCALLGEVLAGRGLERWPLLLALLPAPVIVYHGAADAADLWRGSTWLAAAVAAAAAAHLGRDPAMRAALVALLIAVIVPVALRGAAQSAIPGTSISGPEHAATVETFERVRDEFLADRGWAPDSPEARTYERRLRQPDPRGWFPTVNLFASLMAFGLVFLAALALAALRDRSGRGAAVAAALAAAACAAMLVAARSKGALGAAALGVGFLAWLLLRRRRAGAVALVLVAFALLGVVARGLLPEGLLGEKSLLFRWHYLVGAARVFAAQPWFGAGPGGFQDAYVAVRLPRAPEEVISAHNVFADWLATLGVIGLAWAALLVAALLRAARAESPGAGPAAPGRAILAGIAAVTVLAFVPSIAIEAPSLDTLGLELARSAGVLGYAAAAAGLYVLVSRARSAALEAALAAGVVALLVHAQLEMTFFDPGTVTWMACVVGLAATARPGRPRAALLAGPALLASAVVLFWFGAVRALGAQVLMVKAAGLPFTEPPEGWSRAALRDLAAEMLLAAHQRMPSWRVPLEEAVEQRFIAAALSEGDERRAFLDEAVALADRAVAGHYGPSTVALAADAYALRFAETGDRSDFEAARAWATELAETLDPHGIAAWRRLGDLLWAGGERAAAVDAYGRALQNDANFALDPLRRLSARERERIEARLQGRSPRGS